MLSPNDLKKYGLSDESILRYQQTVQGVQVDLVHLADWDFGSMVVAARDRQAAFDYYISYIGTVFRTLGATKE